MRPEQSQSRAAGAERDSGRNGIFTLGPPRIDIFWLVLYLLLMGACVAVIMMWPELRGFGFVGLIITIALLPIGLRSGSGEPTGAENAMGERLDRVATAIETMTSEAGLSDAAKRVLHRRHERELLRREIQRDIADGDWDAAMILVKELAERFGYRIDAEEFRGRIERARAETLDRSVAGAIENLDGMIRDRRWADAYAEAARVARLFPDSPRVEGLRQRVDESRQRYKIDLERRFLMAAEREEVETAMDLLKELDIYLTEEEAEPFREVARGVIGKARDNLGVRFKLAIQDKNWHNALEVGERIMADFPNTRMAEEVRGMIDSIRTRVSQMSGAGGGRG
ncbi:MAG: hypothetical protein EA376_10110 [Phycisphaeraceae bacterium]|nr:MAG: hypothetical protein EA376_10110 [Phycisphaeraceae bacterium]